MMTQQQAEKRLMAMRDACAPSDTEAAEALSMAIAALRRLAEIRRLAGEAEEDRSDG